MRALSVIFLAASLSTGCGSASSGSDPAATGGAAGVGGTTSTGGAAGAGGGPTGGNGGASAGASSGYEAPGPFPVGHTTFVLTDATRGRMLPIEVWYPADESARAAATAGTPLEDLEAGIHHDETATLVAAAPVPCTRKRTASAADVMPAAGQLPLIAFSHCSGCTRWSSSFLAERLASRGFAVVAPDHVGNTLWDAMAGMNANVDAPFLALRAGDVRFAVDQMLDPANDAVPTALRGHLDGSVLGVYGHSFGALTTGLVLDQDPRFLAGFAVAAPMQLLEPTRLADVHAPLFFLLAKEDHSIGAVGNGVIEGNYADANPPAWLAEVEDAGHYSFSDIAGLVKDFPQGCGGANRQSGTKEPFTYLDNDVARGLAAAYLAAFFENRLRNDAAAGVYLAGAHPDGVVTVSTR